MCSSAATPAIYEGAVIKARAVIAAGTVLTGSTPVYDLPQRHDHQARGRDSRSSSRTAPSSCPARARSPSAPGRDWGLSLATPVIVKYRDDRTDTRTELEAWIR